MDFQFGPLWSAFRAGFLGLTRTPPEQRDPDAIQASLYSTAGSLSVLDAHLADTEYVAGDRLTMGDLALGPMVYRWLNIDIERPPLPNLEAWHERLTEERHGPVHANLSSCSLRPSARPGIYDDRWGRRKSSAPDDKGRGQPLGRPGLLAVADLGDGGVEEEVEEPVGGDPGAALRALQLVQVGRPPEERG